MELLSYFENDDGSLPEIELAFRSPAGTVEGFRLLFARGAKDVSVGGAKVWIKSKAQARPFSGPQDAELVMAGDLEPFHIVLGGINVSGATVPDLGVWVAPEGLTLDYRMGPEWQQDVVMGLLQLLRDLCHIGAELAVPWWGAEAERMFREQVRSA